MQKTGTDFPVFKIPEGLAAFLKERQITLDEYVVTYCIHHNIAIPSLLYGKEDIIDRCIARKFIDKVTGEVLPSMSGLFKASTEDWIDEWRDLFPKGKSQGSMPLRGDRMAIKKKMSRFLLNNNYSPEQIMQATKLYLKEEEKTGYAYTKVAHYLIDKDGVSTLASLCEALKDVPDTISDVWVQKA